MSHRAISVSLTLLCVLAFCTSAVPKSLDVLTNETVREYTANELESGAPSLSITSRILYREAIELLGKGEKDRAVPLLELAANLTGDYAAPLFALARVELFEANPNFLPHATEGFKRVILSYPSQAFLGANLAALVVVSLAGALLATLVALLIKYWPFIDHKVTEIYSRRFAAPPARWIAALACAALFAMRLGIALYIAVLVVVLWAYLGRKEKGLVLTGMVLLAAASFAAPYSNCLAPAIDPESITSRLALVNRRGVNEERIRSIREITGDRFRADKEFAVGTAMYRLGLYEEAQRFFLDAVSLRPDFAPAFVNLGNVYFMQGDYDKALAGYQSAVELDSTSAVAHYNIGQTYIKKMHFAPSDAWLEKANMLGIETYRSAHPTIGLRNPPVYEAGFDPKELWKVARMEGASRRTVLMSEMLRPFFLFPFNWLWVLFAMSLAAAIIVARRLPEGWRIARCDNCGKAICSECENMQTGIRICRDCAEVIRDLRSIKVMEALLRHARQKTATPKHPAYQWRTMFFPGISRTECGHTFSGFSLSLVGSGAIACLVWRGFYFKDPHSMNATEPVWNTLLCFAVLAAAYFLSYRRRPQQEPRNYYVFPAEMRTQVQEKEEEKREVPPDPWGRHETAAPETTRMPEPPIPKPSRVSEPSESSESSESSEREAVAIGRIEKGTKWH